MAAVTLRAPGRLAPQQVVRTVRDGTPAETIATVDAGAHMLVAMPLWEVPEPRRLLISSGLATMGYALPAAIAAALCRPQHSSFHKHISSHTKHRACHKHRARRYRWWPSPATAAWA